MYSPSHRGQPSWKWALLFVAYASRLCPLPEVTLRTSTGGKTSTGGAETGGSNGNCPISMVECDGAGDGEFDGLLDIKDGSSNMTFSYNYFHDHHKVGLMGSSDGDTFDWRVTLQHNRYENVGSRLPLQRGGTTHVCSLGYSYTPDPAACVKAVVLATAGQKLSL